MITRGPLRHLCSQCNQARKGMPHFMGSPLDLSCDLQSQLEPPAWTEAGTLLAMLSSVLVLLKTGESAHCLLICFCCSQDLSESKPREFYWQGKRSVMDPTLHQESTKSPSSATQHSGTVLHNVPCILAWVVVWGLITLIVIGAPDLCVL